MKRNNISLKSITVLTMVYLSFGCNKITEINVTPNDLPIQQATPQLLFPSGVQSTAGRVGGELAILGGIWAQYYTQSASSSQYRGLDSYQISSNDGIHGNYNELMAGALNDYQNAIKIAKEKGQNQYYLMATVMKAYTYEVLVDLYDQVPYTEALQGIDGVTQPKFDDGYSVYKGLLEEIDAALASDYQEDFIEGSADANADFIFGGVMANWTKFANTLKLKMYLRMVNAKPAEAEAGVKSLYAGGGNFLETDAGIDSYVATPDQQNPFYAYNIFRLNTTTNLRASRTLTSWLAANQDPRDTVYFGVKNPTSMKQGDFNSTDPAYGGTPAFVQNANDPVWFISAAESYFMQAEARLRYGVGTKTDADLYDLGLKAAFAPTGFPAPTTGIYVYPTGGTFNAKLKTIIIQKWASFPGSHALEGYFEQLRTGYPEISPVDYDVEANPPAEPGYIPGQLVYSKTGTTAGNAFPKRLVFPDSERSRNPNTPAQVPLTTKVWWAK